MKKIVYSLVLLTGSFSVTAQSIPAGYCGIEFTYDAAGNRTKREYLCVQNRVMKPEAEDVLSAEKSTLYPNPNSGQFSVVFSIEQPSTHFLIMNVRGQLVREVKAGGLRIFFDLSDQPNGVYFLHYDYQGTRITRRVVKVPR